MRVIIAGGRDYFLTDGDRARLDEERAKLPITEVVCGCARGADTGGEDWANSRNIPVIRFPADWDRYGRSAGPRRNLQMAEYADALIAFPGGKGTANMVQQAVERGMKIRDWRTSET
jgi:hypothetical protein